MIEFDSDQTEAIVADAIDAMRPFPQPGEVLALCLAGQVVQYPYPIVRERHCFEEPEVEDYYASVERAVHPILYSAPYANHPGRGFVAFELTFDPDGAAQKLEVTRSGDDRASRKLRRAVAEAAPFGSPPLYERCFEATPMKFHLQVQGGP